MGRRIVLGLVLTFFPAPAWADVVMPEPDDCPSGKVPVTDHGGPRCEDPAPKSCPPGWRGVIGGRCDLHYCRSDAECGAGKVCAEASLCWEEKLTHFQYGAVERPSPWHLLAGPMPPARLGWVPVNVCDGKAACDAPRECRPGKVCVSAGATPASLPFLPDGGVQQPAPPPAPRGCGACGVVAPYDDGDAMALLAMLGLGVVTARRRGQGAGGAAGSSEAQRSRT
ncbi:MAG: hypothetical protein R3B72_03930 [Polyangiaceae bacterium]